jgi:YD repeat-containing protein
LGSCTRNGGSNALSGLARQVTGTAQGGRAPGDPVVIHRDLLKPIPQLQSQQSAVGGSPGVLATAVEARKAAPDDASSDWLTLNTTPAVNPSDAHGISVSWQPAKGVGGGAAQAPRGGSSGSGPASAPARGAITPLSLPPPTASASSAGGASAALLAAAAGANGTATATAPASGLGAAAPRPVHSAPVRHGGQTTPPGNGTGGPSSTPNDDPSPSASGGVLPGSTPNPVLSNGSGASRSSFAYFPVYVLDNNYGVTLYPGVQQVATIARHVDLQAQVSGTTVSSYNWDTSNLSGVSSITGTTTYELQFYWTTNQPVAGASSVTLSVTDINSHTETFTYDFWVPVGTGTLPSGGSNATWPTSLPPSQELLLAPEFPSHNAAVDATSGSLDTDINLPSYNPNVPALALTYDSVAANPQPIIVFKNALSASAALPTKVSAQLTFNSSALTTWYYDTSQFNKGDVQQIALEATNATALATNRYSYSAQVVDIGTTNTTNTYSGTTSLLNYSGNAFGAGWTLKGLEQIYPVTGGVILDLGDEGRTLWFATAGSGGGYTTPAGDFSTLSKNGGTGVYTRTMPDGTQMTFNSGGYETAVIDRNSQHITFAYNGSNQVTTITDNYSNVTTLTYSGGYLQTIKDPAGRIATFTHSGANLSGVTLPDSSTWGYSYASGGQLTQITDPRSKTVTVSYDSGGRVSSVSRPDSTSESFTNDQEQGWTNSGTSGSPAAATLLAAAGGAYTSPNSNTSTIQPDWNGFGMTGNAIDPLGNVQLYDRNSNALPTITVDEVNRNVQYQYDSKGNATKITFEDANHQDFTYNSDSEPLTAENENSKTTNFTYDGSGNLTVVEDALTNYTTMTYTGSGRLRTSKDANGKVTTYQYDSQDRLTTIQFPDSSTNLFTYNSQGDVTKVVDGRNNATTFSFDALNRETGSTDALNDLTTLTYDSGGNLTQDQEPTPAGQTARTTNYAYDSMDRLTTLTDPLSHVTVIGRDSDGNATKITDPLNRVTTVQFE